MAQQTVALDFAAALAGAAAAYAAELPRVAAGQARGRRAAIAGAQTVGKPFTARYGALGGQQAIRVLLAPVVYAEATMYAPKGALVMVPLAESSEVVMSLDAFLALQACSAAVLEGAPRPFLRFGIVNPAWKTWVREHRAAIQTQTGARGWNE